LSILCSILKNDDNFKSYPKNLFLKVQFNVLWTITLFNISCTVYTILCGKTFLKFWNFEFSNVLTLNFQGFRLPHFWNCECFLSVYNRLLSCHIFYHQLNFIIQVREKSFIKMFFLNDRNFRFQKSLTKPKPKIGSNGFLTWVSWHSYVFKRNNV